MFAVKLNKGVDFIGRDALLRLREAPATKRLVQFALRDPAPLLYGNEPIWLGESDRRPHDLGRLRPHARRGDRARLSSNIPDGDGRTWSQAGGFEIEVAGRRFAARASLTPMYDPRERADPRGRTVGAKVRALL